jgi:hypothetical protein
MAFDAPRSHWSCMHPPAPTSASVGRTPFVAGTDSWYALLQKMAMRNAFVLLVAALMALASPAAADGPAAPRLQVQQAKSQFDTCVTPRRPGLIM